jgi:hypothetical protein
MAKSKRHFDHGAQRPVDPEPGVVQVRLLGDPGDIDAVLGLLAAAGGWEVVIHALSPDVRRHPQEKVIGLLTTVPRG